jgi:hypothetical protein
MRRAQNLAASGVMRRCRKQQAKSDQAVSYGKVPRDLRGLQNLCEMTGCRFCYGLKLWNSIFPLKICAIEPAPLHVRYALHRRVGLDVPIIGPDLCLDTYVTC